MKKELGQVVRMQPVNQGSPPPPFDPNSPPPPPGAMSPYAAPNAPGMGAENFQHQAIGPKPTTYLWQSIASTLCCCPPFGIVAIVYAAMVSSKYNRGDYEGALKASNTARTWFIVAVVVGVVLRLISVFMRASSGGY